MLNFFTSSKTSPNSQLKLVILVFGISATFALTSTNVLAAEPILYTHNDEPALSAYSLDNVEKTALLTGAVSDSVQAVQVVSLSKAASDTTRVSDTSNHRTLDRGPLLLSPTENTVVDTAYGTVSVDMGSVVLIVATDNELAVYNLYDRRKNAVVMNYGSGYISISPARAVVLARSSIKSFSEANPAPFVAYRHLSSAEASREMTLHQAEFDFSSMVGGLPALKQLIAESTGSTKKTMERMLKTAAIVALLAQGGESYSYYVPDRLLSAAVSE